MTGLETGEQLALALRAAAAARHISVGNFIKPLTADPNKYLRQLAEAREPRPSTRERIRALIDGAPIPRAYRSEALVPEPPRRRVHSENAVQPQPGIIRDPCPNCAVRADIGCRHRPWTMEGRA